MDGQPECHGIGALPQEVAIATLAIVSLARLPTGRMVAVQWVKRAWTGVSLSGYSCIFTPLLHSS